MPTKVVVAFDSDSPQTDEEKRRVDQSSDFVQVFEALKHDREVAENVFARCAKIEFRSEIGEARLREVKDFDDIDTVWVSENRVVLQQDSDAEHSARLLKSLVHDLASIVKGKGDPALLIFFGALDTQISLVGRRLLVFSVKQRWGFHVKEA